MSDLKPCPFCQGMELYINGCEVECSTCGAMGPNKQVCTDEAIIETWNKRSHPRCLDCKYWEKKDE